MKIESITLSVFELLSNTGQFDLVEDVRGATSRWRRLGRGLADLIPAGTFDGPTPAQSRGALRVVPLDAVRPNPHQPREVFATAELDALSRSVRAHGRAVELRPSYAGAHQWLCWANLLLGNGPEALVFGEKATRLDPLDPEASGNLAVAWLMVGDAERALSETDRILLQHPAFEYALWARGLSQQALGRWEEAAESFALLRDRWTLGWPEFGRAAVAATQGDDLAIRRSMEGLSGR